MEKKLRQLFDYQKFQKDPRLEAMLSETEKRYEGSLSDAELELVSAAGDPLATAAVGLVIPDFNN